MKVLVIGSGGREHALVWKLSQDSRIGEIFCAPGNGGISCLAHCIDVEAHDVDGMLAFAKRERIDFVVVGPESALAAGMVDAFESNGVPAFGPSRQGSMIETSKVFAKGLMKTYGIPSARFEVFDEFEKAISHIHTLIPPYIVKADGLCAGKGAYVIRAFSEGEEALRELLVDRVHGDAGNRVIVEDFLKGMEASYLAFTDGYTTVPMVPSQDHKTLLDGDRGPNTGGMGAYAPVPFISEKTARNVDNSIMLGTVTALRQEGIRYKGVLYAGLMLEGSNPHVLEFNARFGDPETQPILFKMDSDLFPVLSACATGTLADTVPVRWKKGVSICVVLASAGYPSKPEKGQLITGLQDLEGEKDVFVFHAGTKRIGDKFYTLGGRVLGVTALADSYESAIEKVYEAVACIHFDGMHYRTDIGGKALACTLR